MGNPHAIGPLFAILVMISWTDPGATDPLPRTTPRMPAEAREFFRVQGGFHLDPLAAEAV